MTAVDSETGEQQDPAGAWARLSLEIRGIRDRIDKETARAVHMRPIRAPRQAAGTVPATGPLVLDLGAPAMGRRWSVRNLTVSNSAGVRTAAAGTADIYVGNPHIYSADAWRWGLDPLPGAARFSSDQLDVIPQDHLFVVVEGGTSGDVLLARAEVLDFPADHGREVIPL